MNEEQRLTIEEAQRRIIKNGLHDEGPRNSTDVTAALRTLQAVYSQRGLVDPDEGPVFAQDEYACECLDVWMFG
jgi:hypothetical protein